MSRQEIFNHADTEDIKFYKTLFDCYMQNKTIPFAMETLNTGKKNHALYKLKTENKNYFIKEFFLSSAIKPARRFELSLKEIFCKAAQASYNGGVLLYKIGLRTAKPIGWFSANSNFLHYKSIVIFEMLNERKNVEKYFAENPQESTMLLEKIAHIAQTIHANNLRHTDIVLHNFLIHPLSKELSIIDTDKVHSIFWSRPFPFLKTFLDMHCLRRINLSDEHLELLLKFYFQENYTPVWLKIILFWKKWKP